MISNNNSSSKYRMRNNSSNNKLRVRQKMNLVRCNSSLSCNNKGPVLLIWIIVIS